MIRFHSIVLIKKCSIILITKNTKLYSSLASFLCDLCQVCDLSIPFKAFIAKVSVSVGQLDFKNSLSHCHDHDNLQLVPSTMHTKPKQAHTKGCKCAHDFSSFC